ncbi:MAG: hypothetical protein GXO91_02550 [FCB group bacterium]|nr:hypothetical protein [FCB group bacterium]
MIDFHNHLIPHVDDGAKSMEVAAEMMAAAVEQGVTEIIATPHRQHPKFEMLRVSNDDILAAYNDLQDYIKTHEIPLRVHLGAEVYFQSNLLALIHHPFALLGSSRYILVEFSTSFLPLSYKAIFEQLMDLGVTPIIAHPERYSPIYSDFSILKKIYNSGILIQLDAGSLLGTLGRRSEKIARKILTGGYAHFIGSDAHNTTKRNFCLQPAYEVARKLIGSDAEILVTHNPSALIYGDEIISIQQKSKKFVQKISHFISKK